MADRRTRIILGLDADPYVRGLAKASAATKAFGKSLNSNLDSSQTRMSGLVQTSLALGPALVPIGAAAVPAVTSLTASLGAAAGAAGVALLAFNGVGDGLKALNDYQLEPSAANLDKVRQAFHDLGPAGTDFVMFLDKLEPKFDRMQNLARAGLFPGVQEGITSMLERGPQINQIIANISTTLGDLAAEGGEALSSERFDDFFNYIEGSARPILQDMARTLGNVIEAVGNMLVAFDPLSDAFSKGLLGMSRDFAKWSRDLENNKSFQGFVDYIERVSPKVVDTLGSLVTAIADIAKAAAPVGEVTLPIIKAIAEALSAVANSPAGPALIAAAAGISAISRAVAIYNAANGSAVLGLLRKGKADGKKAGAGFRAAGAGIGVLALSMTDLDESVGLSNTAMGIAIGMLGGPWGAAIGGAIGGAIDFANRNDDVKDSLEAVKRAAKNPTDLVTWGDTVEKAVKKTQKALDEATNIDDFGSFTSPAEAWGYGVEKLTGDLQESADKARKAQREFLDVKQTLAEIRAYVKDPDGGFEHLTGDVDKLTRFAKRAAPALKHMGISVEDLKNAGPDKIKDIAAGIREYNRSTDSLPGRTRAVRDAIKSLNNPMINAEQAASNLDDALSNLFDPQLNAREALIEWKQGLVDLRKQIKGTNNTLDLNTKAGRENQQSIIDRIRDLKEVAVTQARADGNTKRATKTLRHGRKAIIQAGVAAGISKKDMEHLVNQMGLVPDVVATKVKTKGKAKTKKDLERIRKWAERVPDKLNIFSDTPDKPKTKKDLKDIRQWAREVPDQLNIFSDVPGAKRTKLDLTDIKTRQDKIDRQLGIHTSAPGANKAKRDIDGVRGAVDKMRDKGVDITLNSKTRGVMKEIRGLLNNLNPFNADGRIWDFNANGDIKNGHVAQIAPAGAWRVWAEEETGGEAYIPFARSKRPRSRKIATETVRRLGGEVQWNADGDITLDTRANISGKPRRDVRTIDEQFAQIAHEFGRIISQGVNQGIQNLNAGFHWPLPRQYGPSGTWGSYASGGSHPALDWPAPLATPIFATLPGKVSSVQHLNSSYGNHVRINHGHGLESISAHMERTAATQGDRVTGGETIGYVDSTGNSTGNHLHLEFRRNGTPINYTSWLHGGGPMGIGMPIGVYDGNHEGMDRAGPPKSKAYARSVMSRWGFGARQWPSLEALWHGESGWRWWADNPRSSAYGIPQSLPGSKMASAGGDWRTNPATQIDWGLGYIRDRYGSPSAAYRSWLSRDPHWYSDGALMQNGIRVFDEGGPWPSGTLGVNLSGQTEYVNSPQTTAAAVQMANGGLLDGFGFGSHTKGRKRLGSMHGETPMVAISVVPGAVRSFKDLLEMVGKPETVHTVKDLNNAWRNMRRESRELDREERQLRRTRRQSRNSNKRLKESERALEEAKNRDSRATERTRNLEDRLAQLRREAGPKTRDVTRAEKALMKVHEKAGKNGKISKAEQKRITAAEDELRRARRKAGGETKKIRKMEARLRKAREDETITGQQLHRIRRELQRQRKRAKLAGKDATKQEKAVERQRKKLTKATERWKNMQAELLEQAKAVSDAITKQGAVFGGEGTSNTAQGLLSKLRGSANKANQFRRLYQNAVRRGVDRDILDQILEQGSTPEAVNLLTSLAAAPDALIKRINRQENRLQNIADRVGTWTTTRQGQGRFAKGTPGRAVVQNFNGPIYTQDPKAAAREIEARWRKGLLMAKGA